MDLEETITLGTKEQRRAWALTRLLAGEWTQAEASQALGLSVRQVRRLLGAYRVRGPAALVHGNRGRAPVHRVADAVRAQIVAAARPGGRYAGLNHAHLTEQLNEVEAVAALQVSRPTVRRILLAAGLTSPRPRRAPRHRSRRERMAQEGQLLQADGSPHRWLGPDGPEWTLIAGIDDATGRVEHAVFRAQEDAAGYMTWLRRVVETKGIPLALYVDRHGIFQRSRGARGRTQEPLTLEEERAGGPLPTQFGRVLEELGIRVIHARSPQAKGRVERLWGTFQDRLVSELRLAGVTTLEAANAYVPTFLRGFNRRFAVPPAQSGAAYQPLPPHLASAAARERVFCFKYARTVGNDNTVQFAGQRLQLLPGPSRRSYARSRVELHERLDSTLAVFATDGTLLATRPAPPEAPVLRARDLARPPRRAAPSPSPTPSSPEKPTRLHPWKQSYKGIRPDQHDLATADTWRTRPMRTESLTT